MTYHLLGIGGVGMSALATLLVRQGHTVSGSDRTLGTPNLRFLESIGVKIFPDDGSGVDASIDELIVSTAIEETNAGLVRAKALGITVTHRAKALSTALAEKKLIAVVGTCGKSTVTAMLGHILAECGLDPLCVNGANVPGWEGAVRFGKGEYAVAEVDESDKSLVAFHPYAAIVTNASADHYSKEEMDQVFDDFVKDLPGPLVDGRKGLGGLEGLEVPVPGRHNLANAALAVAMAVKLGVDKAKAIEAMKSFGGVERRLQLIPAGKLPNFKAAHPAVYDDYAHNPEKLRAMITTLQEKYARGVLVIWRPHGYGPLRKMLSALAEMFADTLRPEDALVLLPVYDAGGTADRSINSEALLADILGSARSPAAFLVPTLSAAFAFAIERASLFGAIVTAGARDPGLPVLARRLAKTRVARTFCERARGLIARPRLGADEGLFFSRCRAIHTCFMRYPIEVTFFRPRA